MKDGESSMEQTEILLTIQRQLTMLQSTIDTLREQSRQKDEEIERLRQIILNLLHLLSILPERAERNKDFEVDDLLPWSEEMKSWFSAV